MVKLRPAHQQQLCSRRRSQHLWEQQSAALPPTSNMILTQINQKITGKLGSMMVPFFSLYE